MMFAINRFCNLFGWYDEWLDNIHLIEIHIYFKLANYNRTLSRTN